LGRAAASKSRDDPKRAADRNGIFEQSDQEIFPANGTY
jgi:hypothetical protein